MDGVRTCGMVWNCVESVECSVENFHTQWAVPLLLFLNIPEPYQVRVKSVPSPCLWVWRFYGDSTEILRRGYGGDTESLRRRYEEATVNTCGCVSFHLRQWRLTLPQALAVATASVFLFLYLLDLVFLAGCNDEVISLYHTTSTYCIEFFCLRLRVVLPGSCYFPFAATLR